MEKYSNVRKMWYVGEGRKSFGQIAMTLSQRGEQIRSWA